MYNSYLLHSHSSCGYYRGNTYPYESELHFYNLSVGNDFTQLDSRGKGRKTLDAGINVFHVMSWISSGRDCY